MFYQLQNPSLPGAEFWLRRRGGDKVRRSNLETAPEGNRALTQMSAGLWAWIPLAGAGGPWLRHLPAARGSPW